MLRELHIKNIAVIEEVTVSFYDGFHVLTGETGAGKSILIDSINMALGERTSKDLIRTGAESAAVDIVFEVSDIVEKKLNELGIESEDGMLYISRQITADGKSRCRINGHMVPLSMLKESSVYLLTIHGQHDNQSLLSPKAHIEFVDFYGDYGALLTEYRLQYSRVLDIRSRLNKLQMNEAEKEHKIDLLSYQINEISSSEIKIGEEEELEDRKSYLTNIEEIVENSNEAYDALYGSEQESAAYDRISSAVHCLGKIHSFDENLNELYNMLSSVLADVEDVTHELRSYLDKTDYNQGELDTIEDRLAVISSLKRKYGDSEKAILEYLESAKAELNEIECSDAACNALTKELEEESNKLHELAAKLSDCRKDCAISLQTEIMHELSDLDMQKMRFSVAVEPLFDENGEIKYTPAGCDRVEFLISGNPGESLKPLSKIASGGEMSRIMLAIKSVLADSDIVETLIFDEIDTGVSGRAAQKIAEKIRMLAKKRQILCITHLAQIAGMADIHYLVEKSFNDINTHTTVTQLDDEKRKTELARIIGGVKITELTLQAAQEMLDMAKER